MHAPASSTASLLLSFLYMVNAATIVRPAPAQATVFAVYPGWDMNNGGDSVLTFTEANCLQACASNFTCMGYTYTPYGEGGSDPLCILRTTIDLSTFDVQSFDTSTGLVGDCTTFKPVGPTHCFTVFQF